MILPVSRLWTRISALRALPRAVRVVAVLFFLAGLVDGVLMPFFALWAQRQAGIPTGAIGLLLGCYAGGELLVTPLVGGIADRLGRRLVLLVSMSGIGAGFLMLGFTHGAIPAGMVLLLIGAFESVLHPTLSTIIVDCSPSDRLQQRFALVRVASGVGRMAGPALGAVLAGWSLNLVFTCPATAMLAGIALAASRLPDTMRRGGPDGEDDGDEGDEGEMTALRAVLRDRRLVAVLLPLAAMGLAASWIEIVLPLDAADGGTLAPSGVGLLFTWAGAVGVALQFPVTAWATRIGGTAAVRTGGFLLLLAFASLVAASHVWALVAAVTLAKLADMLVGPTIQAIVAERAPRAARATFMAALSVVQDLEDAAGPATGIALFAAAPLLPWVVGASLIGASSLALAGATRRHAAEATRAKTAARLEPVASAALCSERRGPAGEETR